VTIIEIETTPSAMKNAAKSMSEPIGGSPGTASRKGMSANSNVPRKASADQNKPNLPLAMYHAAMSEAMVRHHMNTMMNTANTIVLVERCTFVVAANSD
jgi:hypothetical protein